MDIKKVYYKHYRWEYCGDNNYVIAPYSRTLKQFYPESNGGETECHLVLQDNSEIIGIAECSLKDNFNYKIGRAISYGRAMKKYHEWLDFINQQKQDYVTTVTTIWQLPFPVV